MHLEIVSSWLHQSQYISLKQSDKVIKFHNNIRAAKFFVIGGLCLSCLILQVWLCLSVSEPVLLKMVPNMLTIRKGLDAQAHQIFRCSHILSSFGSKQMGVHLHQRLGKPTL